MTKSDSFLTQMKPAGIVIYRRNIEDSRQYWQTCRSAIETTGKLVFHMIDEEPDGALNGTAEKLLSAGISVLEKRLIRM